MAFDVSQSHTQARFGAALVLCALVASTIALTMAAAAYVLPWPRWAEALDVVTPLTGHVLIGGAAGLIALRQRRWRLATLAGSVIVALLLHAGWTNLRRPRELWPIDAAMSSTQPRTALRVYALNTWDHNRDLPRLESALAAIDADVLLLSEIDDSKRGLLERLQQRYPYHVACPGPSNCAMALLSRFPILAGRAARLGDNIPPVAWARIDATVVGLASVTVIGTHVHRPSRNPWAHARQMRSLAQMVLATRGPIVVAGDLNAGGWSASFQDLLRLTGLEPATTLMPTWPAAPVQLPQVALDHVLVSRDLSIVRAGAGPATGSDHLPVFAEIRPKL